MFRYLLTAFILLFALQNEKQNEKSFAKQFEKISSQPTEIKISNLLEINNDGGHIQGIQLLESNRNTYAVATGSSDSYSYYSVVKLGNNNKVISVNKLMDKPFKHAGGFQIFENYLAVGIEDNSAKDKSKFCIYSIENPENPSTEPISVVERKGEVLRSTAGCVGITGFKNQILVAVGDWDTKHIDFYVCDSDKIKGNNFKLGCTIDTNKMSKENWSDKNWAAYQNINLFNENGTIYMVGLGQNSKEQNAADLYILEGKFPDYIQLKKISSRLFETKNEVNFKAAAGISFINNKIHLIACNYHLEPTSFINLF